MNENVFDLSFINFLYRAKLNTFASGEETLRKKDGSKSYTFKDNLYLYKDKYFGNIFDCGQEIVWFNGRPIWAMVYRGGLIRKTNLSKECFHFLQECLCQMDKKLPIRGPKKYCSSLFNYINKFYGDIEDFWGQEKIYYKKEMIYYRRYYGGCLILK